jgi:glutamate-ammonia-ligase adenylyltransferase
VAAADVVGLIDLAGVERSLTTITATTLAAALDIATRAVLGAAQPHTRLALIGMGRLGGNEQGYGSDADVLFVHRPVTAGPGRDVDERGAADEAHAIANEVRRLLGQPGADPALSVDADLRPEGRQGPLVRTLDAYAAYYSRWSHPWETQALVRAAPVAGDAELGEQFIALANPLRWPAGGVPADTVREIRRIKARVEAERLPRGKDPKRNVKLGPGGLADVEWTVQLLQLQHAGDRPALQTTGTLDALTAAVEDELISVDDADALRAAWLLSSRLRNAMMLAAGRRSDVLPTDARALDRVARLVGYGPGESGRLIEDHLRTTRRARSVVTRVFYT